MAKDGTGLEFLAVEAGCVADTAGGGAGGVGREGFIRGGGGGGGYLVRACGSRMGIDPRKPTMPGRSTSGLHQRGRYCLHQARSAVRCSASRMKGELHPSKNRSQDGIRRLVHAFLLCDQQGKIFILCFLV